MKVSITTIVLFFAFTSLQAQYDTIPLPIFQSYEIDWAHVWELEDTIQKEYFENGNIKTEIIQIEDSFKLRKEYFENGFLKYTVEVIQQVKYDTSEYVDWDYDDNYDIAVEIVGLEDVFQGQYIEYFKTPNQQVKAHGSYNQFIQVDKWNKFDTTGTKYTANFNSEGDLEGKYFEYFESNADEFPILKCKGQFGKVAYTDVIEEGLGEDNFSITIEIVEPVGIWTYYDEYENVTHSINYDLNRE